MSPSPSVPQLPADFPRRVLLAVCGLSPQIVTVGRWTLRGKPDALAALWPWLGLGQWLHVGKNATMGMGGFALQGDC